MSIPAEDVVVPEHVRLLARGADLECVWRNDYGGLTFRATGTAEPFYIKWGPRNLEFTLSDEAERMRWASGWITVPTVLDSGADDTHEWMITAALDGLSAVDPRWIAEPATAVRAVGEGLRAMHEALPVRECPWEWSVPSRIANAERRGIVVPESLRTAPAVDRLVVSHGDACCPNTLEPYEVPLNGSLRALLGPLGRDLRTAGGTNGGRLAPRSLLMQDYPVKREEYS
ncbi:MAG: aminoglycoside phosphotransferase APH(3') [Actinobacteria bacterium HGW-Actinobacteria-11]|nr:MAG: aminoglycoside phosphotransferase APH(3') [Actinobacteria bacterium HGW-Actinobacteria-11]